MKKPSLSLMSIEMAFYGLVIGSKNNLLSGSLTEIFISRFLHRLHNHPSRGLRFSTSHIVGKGGLQALRL